MSSGGGREKVRQCRVGESDPPGLGGIGAIGMGFEHVWYKENGE
jgi:hypothetical protein